MSAARSRRAILLATGLVVAAGCGKAPPPSAAGLAAGTGAAHPAEPGGPALCEHRVPAQLCTKCNPDLAAVFKATGDWCGEHGVPESQCLQCNPGLKFGEAAAPADWCGEHGVPESMCTKCKPQLVAKYIEAGDFCREHGLPQSVCTKCNPDLLEGRKAPVFPEPGTKVTLASAQTERDVGIETVTAKRRKFSRSLEVVGTLDFDRNRFAELSTRADGQVLEVKVDVGDRVRPGDPLVVIASAAIGEDRARLAGARARLDAARAALTRERSLLESQISSRKDVEEAQRELAAAEAEAGVAEAALRAAGAGTAGGGGRYVLSAPIAGTVVRRPAGAGRTFAAGEVLVEVADLSRMWAVLGVPEEVAPDVRVGQRVLLSLEGSRREPRDGTIARVGAAVDPDTRTVPARVELPNPDGRLLAGTYVRAKVLVAEDREALLVPQEAVQRAEGTAIVFVRKQAGSFIPVPVAVGPGTETELEILEGLEARAEVVTTGAFLLKTEILKDSIGAGCTDGD